MLCPRKFEYLVVAMRVLWSNSASIGAWHVAVFALLVTTVFAGVDNPTPANFLRRPYANAVVIGDYVYIDGGELSQLEDGAYNGDHASYAGM